MEYAYSVLMACFSGALLLYAGILALTGDTDLIPRSWAARIRDRKTYARMTAKVTALAAAAPALSALVGLIPGAIPAALIVLAAALAFFLWLGVRVSGPWN